MSLPWKRNHTEGFAYPDPLELAVFIVDHDLHVSVYEADKDGENAYSVAIGFVELLTYVCRVKRAAG
ncbi:Hypothetical protein AT6N2_L0994 [Agrobacterium tumefaciens]|nr:Hypothetical protein AT6N2_L0994 [Agrobacterium tumefaciens]